MPDDVTVDKAVFDALLRKIAQSKPLPLKDTKPKPKRPENGPRKFSKPDSSYGK
jgi:hypothetical protein